MGALYECDSGLVFMEYKPTTSLMCEAPFRFSHQLISNPRLYLQGPSLFTEFRWQVGAFSKMQFIVPWLYLLSGDITNIL